MVSKTQQGAILVPLLSFWLIASPLSPIFGLFFCVIVERGQPHGHLSA